MAGVRAVLDLTDATWERHVPLDGRPALIQFWAPWSGPCYQQTKIVDRLAEHFGDRARFFRVHVDHSADLAHRVGVSTVPYVVVLLRDIPVFQAGGLQPESGLQRLLYRLVE